MSQGTDSLLAFADELRAAAQKNRDYIGVKHNSALMERAAAVIERLAPLEPDLEAQPGEN